MAFDGKAYKKFRSERTEQRKVDKQRREDQQNLRDKKLKPKKK